MQKCYALYKDGEMVYLGGTYDDCVEYLLIIVAIIGDTTADYSAKIVTAK